MNREKIKIDIKRYIDQSLSGGSQEVPKFDFKRNIARFHVITNQQRTMKTTLYILITLLFTLSCRESQKSAKIREDIVETKIINQDSLLIALYQFAEKYFKSNSIDTITTLNGTPKYVSKIPAGFGKGDSSLTVGYDHLKFIFWKDPQSYPELRIMYLLESKIPVPGNLTIGKTTRKGILHSLGLPDFDHNDPGRSMTKAGDTIVYGTQSGVGDTVTFVYYINADVDQIDLAMTKDTLRQISWSKKPVLR